MKHYSYRYWLETAKTLSSDKEIRNFFIKQPVIGQTIKNIRILGYDYQHTQDTIEEQAYTQLLKQSPGKAQLLSSYPNIPDDVLELRYAEIDEPFILEFTDGQQLEILADAVANEFYISFNEIPLQAKPSINRNNIDGNVLFSVCLDKTITDIEFSSKNSDSVPDVILRLNDGNGLQINGWADYCEISLINRQDEIVSIPLGELKKGLHLPEPYMEITDV